MKDIKNFLEKVERIFFAVDVMPHRYKISKSLETVRLLEALEQDEVSKEMVVKLVKSTLDEIETAFVAAAQSYAHLRLVYRYKGLRASQRVD